MSLSEADLQVSRIGSGRYPSPLAKNKLKFVPPEGRVLVHSTPDDIEPYLASGKKLPAFEAAGPRSELAFDPKRIRCGIVTCGGLCPGLNSVIRSLVLTLYHVYGVQEVDGFRYGYVGLTRQGDAPMVLNPMAVADIHNQGGTLLGSSRGGQDIGEMVETLVEREISILFAIGGDGTMGGASAIAQEITRRGLEIAIIAVPKTIDNDLTWIERSFGFSTAVEEASRAITAAHSEARGAFNGIGLVKLMGRHSGFIAANAALANSDVDFCLVPEVPVDLHSDRGFLRTVKGRTNKRHHAVVVVAEGAAQDAVGSSALGHDPSGNVRLGDVGGYFRGEIERYYQEKNLELTLKYIDPSYIIRSLPPNAFDSQYCLTLGQHAVHAGMAGRTDIMIGYWNQRFTHVPISMVVGRRKQVDPAGALWQNVLIATGQPSTWGVSDTSTPERVI